MMTDGSVESVPCALGCGGTAAVTDVEDEALDFFQIMPTVTKSYRCVACGKTFSRMRVPKDPDAPTDADIWIAAYHGRHAGGGVFGAVAGVAIGNVAISPNCDCESCSKARVWGQKSGSLKDGGAR